MSSTADRRSSQVRAVPAQARDRPADAPGAAVAGLADAVGPRHARTMPPTSARCQHDPARPPARRPPAAPASAPTTATPFVDDYEWLRDKDSPDTLAYLEAGERLHRGAHRPPRGPARGHLRRDQGAHPGDRPLGAVPDRRLVVLRPLPRGQAVRRQLPLPGRRHGPATTGRPRRSPPRSTYPASRCCSTSTSSREGHDFFSLGTASVSPDGHLLAFSTDTVGNERFLLRVKDLRTGEVLPDQVPDTLGGAHLGPRRHHALLHDRRRGLAPRQGLAPRAGHPGRATTWSSTTRPTSGSGPRSGRTRSDRLLVIGSGLEDHHGVPRPRRRRPDRRVPRRRPAPRRASSTAVEHAVIAGEDCLLVLHNEDARELRARHRAPVDATSHEQWQPLLPHDPAVRLEDVDAFAGHLVVSQRSDGLTQLRVIELDDAAADGLGEDFLVRVRRARSTPSAPAATRSSHQPTVRLGYVTLADPAGGLRLRRSHARRCTLLQAHARCSPGPDAGLRPRRATSSTATWADRPRRHPGADLAGRARRRRRATAARRWCSTATAPTRTPSTPSFSIARLSLLDRGIGFAIAHVRGGGEMGRHWYDDGKLLHKPNTFTDFVACARAPRRRRAGPPRTGWSPRAAAPAAC